jgi:hypothetical protein
VGVLVPDRRGDDDWPVDLMVIWWAFGFVSGVITTALLREILGG